ncbi:uncharacterized protein LOC131598616 [Vicia villosa]|uniref:uncharacterized protein LOC131598616 n=1 Tax=Vicia villosa TaxID=3911 RepID=UPI00273A9D42|nr:uncharacterized protein LOC131598616 [Vicia villosa]
MCFPLPKAVIHKIEAICRAFVWTGKDKGHKSPVAWHQVCRPIKQGGMNIINMGIWNQVALLKCLWNIAMKLDNLWVKWVHLYYLKRNNIWTASTPTTCTWIMRAIFERRSDAQEHHQIWLQMQNIGKFSMKRMYDCIIPTVPNVSWSSLIQHNQARPRSVVCLWLACQDRLATKVRLKRLGLLQSEHCSFCNEAPEDFNHLLIECRICSVVWKEILQWLQVRHTPRNWLEEIKWLTSSSRGKGFVQSMLKISIAETVYALWSYRNTNIFDRNNVDNINSVVRRIIDMIVQRGWMKPKHRSKLAVLML